jgi:uncharacterized iron-regulated protein
MRGVASYRLPRRRAAVAALALTVLLAFPACAGNELAANPAALAEAMRGHRVVVLGEVHDNGAQHALRLAALKIALDGGARPALAFEQFDREQQPDIDRARRERPRDADYLIAQAKATPSWNWTYYRPFVQLALDYDLPLVAANLARGDAMRVATAAAPAQEPKMPPPFLRAHEAVIAKGHCDLLPAEALPGMARAQIARDAALAQAIRPYVARGVVLLTGNGHARTDIGVPYWLTADERATAISIGVLERGEDERTGEGAAAFDAYLLTEPAPRADPCVELRAHMRPEPAAK